MKKSKLENSGDLMPGKNHQPALSTFISILLVLAIFSACAPNPQPSATPSSSAPTAAPSYQAEVDLEVEITPNTPSGQFF